MFPDLHRNEEGLALITSLFAILILTGLSVLFVASATNLTKQSRISTTYERAIHLSEAAVDDVIARVSTDDLVSGDYYVTKDATGAEIVYDGSDEESWALAQAATVHPDEIIPLEDGEAVGIRPRDASGPMNVIYGVSYVPNRANAVETRVIRVSFQRKLLKPRFAFQTGPACDGSSPAGVGGLSLQGGGSILDGDPSTDPDADVHTNGSISVTGSNFVVDGTLTAGPGGTVAPGVDAPDGTSAPTADDQPCEDIPIINPRDVYVRSINQNHVGNTSGGQWRWDLCYDAATDTATVRLPAAATGPCTGTVHADLTGGAVGVFQGWTFDDNKLVWSTNAVQGGIYYIYGASAKINGSEGGTRQYVTVLVESLTGDESGSGTSCTGGSNTGNLCLAGNPKLEPAYKDIQFIASRDIEFGGTPGSQFKGLVTAGEQVGVTGNAALEGAVIAQDRADTSGSVLHKNVVSGSMTLTFDGDLAPFIDSVVRVTAWNELK